MIFVPLSSQGAASLAWGSNSRIGDSCGGGSADREVLMQEDGKGEQKRSGTL